MKKISLLVLFLILLCTGCQKHKDITNEINVSLINPQEIEYINERGWFNDGYTYIVYSCDDITFLDDSWKTLPIDFDLGFLSSEPLQISQIKYGYYYFEDRSPKECEALMNYTLAIYDTDTKQVHYFKSDS